MFVSDKGGIEFEFPLIPTAEELRQMWKDRTREKLFIIDGTTKDMKEHLSNKGWDKVTIAVIPVSEAHEVEEHKEIELNDFHFSHLGVSGEGMLIKDTDEVVAFQSHYNVMANMVGRNDSEITDSPEYGRCTITVTKIEESLK
jgi:hypothetical protein